MFIPNHFHLFKRSILIKSKSNSYSNQSQLKTEISFNNMSAARQIRDRELP